MRINTNMNAMTALNSSTKNTALAGTSMEKLSSGLRINKAGDDAAGLAISEKMRSQIRGLDQASKNTQDGISVVQTAEGAMEEIGNITQRMRELSIQSANETNSVEDRAKIVEELKQLHSEIDRIADTTEFNGKKLLNGTTSTGTTTNNSNTTVTTEVSFENLDLADDRITGNTSIEVSGNLKDLGVEDVEITFANGSENNEITIGLKDKDGNIIATTTVDAGKNTEAISVTELAFKFEDENGNTLRDNDGNDIKLSLTITEAEVDKLDGSTISGKVTETKTPVDNTNVSFGNTEAIGTIEAEDITGNLKELGVDSIKVTKDGTKLTFELLDKNGATIGTSEAADGGQNQTISFKDENGNTLQDKSGTDITITGDFDEAAAAITGSVGELIGKVTIDENATTSVNDEMSLNLQVGANSGQNLEVKISNVKTDNLGLKLEDIENLSSADLAAGTEAANNLTEKLDSALERINTSRANLGAYQNRLEYAQNNLTTSNENLTAAESRIRDVDVAAEMMNLSKLNLINQASQAMMMQAKSQPEGVMQLLR